MINKDGGDIELMGSPHQGKPQGKTTVYCLSRQQPVICFVIPTVF